MKIYWRNGGINPRILDLGTMEVRGPLQPQVNSPWYLLDRRLCGPQSRSGRSGEGKNSQLLPALEPPIIQHADQLHTTELYRLHSF
jgi:hypothetical protein